MSNAKPSKDVVCLQFGVSNKLSISNSFKMRKSRLCYHLVTLKMKCLGFETDQSKSTCASKILNYCVAPKYSTITNTEL